MRIVREELDQREVRLRPVMLELGIHLHQLERVGQAEPRIESLRDETRVVCLQSQTLFTLVTEDQGVRPNEGGPKLEGDIVEGAEVESELRFVETGDLEVEEGVEDRVELQAEGVVLPRERLSAVLLYHRIIQAIIDSLGRKCRVRESDFVAIR